MKVLTVVMPVYNRSGVVERSISSLKNLAPINFEFIVVDDGSDDDSAAVCEKVIAEKEIDGKVIVLDKNSGPATARNKGLDLAATKWVMFLDSDDQYLPGAGHVIETSLESNPEAEMHSFGYIVNGIASPSYTSGSEHPMLAFLRNKFFNTNTCVFRLDLLNKERFAEGYRVGEDTDFWARLLFRLRHVHTNKSIAQYNLEHKVRVPGVHPFFDVTLNYLNVTQEEKEKILNDWANYVFLQRTLLRDVSFKEVMVKRRLVFIVAYLFGDKFYGAAWRINRWLKK